jgi:hypothetical protein
VVAALRTLLWAMLALLPLAAYAKGSTSDVSALGRVLGRGLRFRDRHIQGRVAERSAGAASGTPFEGGGSKVLDGASVEDGP